MKRKTRSILEELNIMSDRRDKVHAMEARATSLIESAINLINKIHETHDSETADDLEKRLINSIRTKDPRKFSRGIRKIKND